MQRSNNRKSDQISFQQHQRVKQLIIDTQIDEDQQEYKSEDAFDDSNDDIMIIEDVDEDDLQLLRRDKMLHQQTNDSHLIQGSFLIQNNTHSTSRDQQRKDKNFTIVQNDMFTQIAEMESDDKAQDSDLDDNEDYMDRFFEGDLHRRNRRTSPIFEKPDFMQRLLVKEEKKFEEKEIFQISQPQQQQHHYKRNTISIDPQSSLLRNHLIQKAREPKYKEEDKAQKQIKDQKLEKEEEDPYVPSENEETLAPEENVDNYLQSISTLYEESMMQQEQSLQDSLIQSQAENVQALKNSIISSVTDMLQIMEDSSSHLDSGKAIDEDLLKIEFTEDFTSDFYLSMHQDVLTRDSSPRTKKKAQLMKAITEDDWDYKDVVKIIDWNERRHRELAQQRLKDNAVISLQNVNTQDVKIRVLSQFQVLNSVSNKMQKERSFSKAKATCVALSDGLIMVGTSEGSLQMFDKSTEKEYSNFSEKTKDFIGNAVTAVDVHPQRPEYAVIGFERGQLVLIDVHDPKKSLKVIKDHHKEPIINLKFADWQGSYFFDDNKKDDSSVSNDKQAWMFISIDQSGKVIINSVTKILFALKASKHIIIDPAKYDGAINAGIASSIHQSKLFDDVPLIALGNAEGVSILEVRPGKHHEFATFERPFQYYHKPSDDYKSFAARVPSLSWGYGSSPCINDRPHSLLAIAWGPLIQLIVLLDNEGADKSQPFIPDGYYVIRSFGKEESPFNKQIRRSTKTNKSLYSDPKQLEESKNSLTYSTVQTSEYSQTRETESNDFDNRVNNQNLNSQQNEGYDYSIAFDLQQLDIEQIQFFSDSTLLIITKSQELRILNVSDFYPDIYDPENERRKAQEKKKKSQAQENSEKVELEYGLKITPELQKSEYGALYQQSIKFYQGLVIALTIKNVQVSQHITWQKSVYEFKKSVEDDLVKVFSRALEIYQGKVKGYAGLPDQSNQRELKLKNEIKLLVREIIQQVIQKTRSTHNFLLKKDHEQQFILKKQTQNDDQQSASAKKDDGELIDFKDERAQKYSTLIRIAIEFCVELKDQYFLFYDLFLLFKEEQLEDAFIHELEPFIMAGKFQEWDLPNEVIQNHVLKYYKGAEKADALEKIIINLNLNQCPKQIVLEFIHYSEQHFLTTAILYLYTQVFEKKDNTSCVQVLFSLFDLYKKAGKRNQGAFIDIQNLREFTFESPEKKKVEKSQIYLGYKILWVIRMFLDGLKFPQGIIRSKKWRTYIHDIMQTLQANDILKVLLEIDAESFFQTISIIFQPSKPFELFYQGRDEATDQNLQSLNHAAFIKNLDSFCMSLLASDNIKYQYLYFAANVISKSPIKGMDSLYYYNITKELMINNKRYLEYNQKLQQMQEQRNERINSNLNKYRKEPEDFKRLKKEQYIIKVENDFLRLLELSEPLDHFQITELLKLTEYTNFNHLKILLLDMKEEYFTCLQMLLHEFEINPTWTEEVQSQRVVKWIREKITILEQKAQASNVDKNLYEQFKREVSQHVTKILVMNPAETIHLIEDKLGGIHKEMLDQMSREPLLQMKYLDTLLVEKEELIETTIKNHGLQSVNQNLVKRFIEFLKLHLRLCCQYQQHKVLGIVQKMIKDSYYPIEDCLEICQEFNQIEATFILNRKIGRYFECVQQGLQLLKSKVDLQKLKIELFLANSNMSMNTTFPIHNSYLVQCSQFDSQFKLILKICKKNCHEVEHDKEEKIWYIVYDTLTEMKNDPLMIKKLYGKQFFKDRLLILTEELVTAVKFENFMTYILSRNKNIRFKEFGPMILRQFSKEISEANVLKNANSAIYKVNSELFREFSYSSRKGIPFRQRQCLLCKRYVDAFMYPRDSEMIEDQLSLMITQNPEDDPFFGKQVDFQVEPVEVFACKHIYHMQCLEHHFMKRKKNESEYAYQRRVEKLRCPTCNLKNFDIEKKSARRTPRSTPKKQLTTIYIKDGLKTKVEQLTRKDSRKISSDDQQQQQDQTQIWEKERQRKITMLENEKQRKLEKMKKRLELFEHQMDMEGLIIKDFKVVQ